MPPKIRPLGSYLEWNNGTIRVTVAVPRHLRGLIGSTRLKRSLNTDSPANAERIKHGVVQELKNQIAAAELRAKKGTSSLTGEALSWREDLESPLNEAAAETLGFILHERAEEIEKRAGEVAAKEFYDIASGQATPVDAMLETYLTGSGLRERSVDEARRAVRVYMEWCASAGIPQTLEAANRKTAGRFVTERLLSQLARKTVEKYLSFLSSYWDWLEPKGYVTDIPWSRQLRGVKKGKVKRTGPAVLGGTSGTGKRPYTRDEARRLLHAKPSDTGGTAQRTRDLTWIGALSGMRIDEICRLRVADCADGWFNVNVVPGEGKTEAGTRRIPIHSRLVDIVARRTKGKSPTAYLIEDLPEPEPGSNRERSMPASKAYTRFRRELGIDERPNGKRQSNVDFHSWRRWFILEARDAGGNTLWTIADAVGHDTKSLPGGLTMGQYPGPASEANLRACIESVQPPEPEAAT